MAPVDAPDSDKLENIMSAQKKLRLYQNQYTRTKPTKAEHLAELFQHCIKEESDELGVFTCFIPVLGKEVETIPSSSGYKRMNFNRKKIVTHKPVHTLNPQFNPTMDTSCYLYQFKLK